MISRRRTVCFLLRVMKGGNLSDTRPQLHHGYIHCVIFVINFFPSPWMYRGQSDGIDLPSEKHQANFERNEILFAENWIPGYVCIRCYTGWGSLCVQDVLLKTISAPDPVGSPLRSHRFSYLTILYIAYSDIRVSPDTTPVLASVSQDGPRDEDDSRILFRPFEIRHQPVPHYAIPTPFLSQTT